jgi:cytosine/uracil/thiamine/allantoin permease
MANHPVKDSDIKKIGLKNMSREKAAWKTWETLNSWAVDTHTC